MQAISSIRYQSGQNCSVCTVNAQIDPQKIQHGRDTVEQPHKLCKDLKFVFQINRCLLA